MAKKKKNIFMFEILKYENMPKFIKSKKKKKDYMIIKKEKTKKEKSLKRIDLDSPLSYDPIKDQDVNYDGWAKFLSYYRYYPDKFACEILGVNLYPFQKLLFRAMAHHKDSVLKKK
jgi:hypothetical protein